MVEPMKGFGIKNYHRYASTAIDLALPMLGILYGFNRFIIICHAQLIDKYCSRGVMGGFIACIIIFCTLVGCHEIFDKNYVSIHGFNAILAGNTEKKHEQFTGIMNVILLFVVALAVFFVHGMFVKKMNKSLRENVAFLKSMDGNKYERRIASYQLIMLFNSSLLILQMMSITITLSRTIFLELFTGHYKEYDFKVMDLALPHVLMTMSVVTSLEPTLFAVFVFFFLPLMREFGIRLSSFFAHIAGKSSTTR